MTRKWHQLKALRDRAVSRHMKRSGIESLLREETHKILKRGLPRKRRGN